MNDFDAMISQCLPDGLYSENIETIQVNLGRYCNLSCRHCHLECSPERREMMSWHDMQKILKLVQESSYRLVDVTGGAPELHPHFREFIAALRDTGQSVQVRTNLISLLEPSLAGMGAFLRDHAVALVGSLPCYLEENVDAQRGPGVHKKSMEALRMLNRLGYGRHEDLPLSLIHNPGGPFLPGEQSELEAAYRQELRGCFDVFFTRLLVLTNMPIGRFKRSLEQSGETADYASCLRDHFNPANLAGLMCRHQVSIDWNGRLYDCDFNLALGMPLNHSAPAQLATYDRRLLEKRQIVTGAHCFGCTAGCGSSCAGSLQ